MFLDFTKVEKIFLVTGKTDLRKGIDGLARIIQQDYELNVYEDAIFLFAAIDVTDLNYSTGITMASFSGINESKTAGSNGREKGRGSPTVCATDSLAT